MAIAFGFSIVGGAAWAASASSSKAKWEKVNRD
jgi:hypothetical protein